MLEAQCVRCQSIDWNEPDEGVFSSSVTRDEKLRQLVSFQPCAFCRLVMHLLSPKESSQMIAEVQNGSLSDLELHYKTAYFGGKSAGRRAVTVQLYKLNGVAATVGHIYEPILTSEPGSASQADLGYPQVTSETILPWIEECDGKHTRCNDYKHAIKDMNTGSIRLIDVVEMKLVRAEITWRYIALSYVWGRINMFETQRQIVSLLEEPKGLCPYLEEIPRTIQDAMRVVNMLGERFLWVSSICIVQNDTSEQMAQIQQMDKIYAKAFLTIVAASGNDATCGLPGVSLGSRSSPRAIEIVGTTKLVAEPLDSVADYIPVTTYETRGWTFQERMLSSRCLFFTDKLIMFQCQTVARTELSKKDLQPDFVNPLIRTRMAPDSLKEPQWSTVYSLYVAMVSDYTLRQLTYRSDMLNAFTGITSWITRLRATRFSFGLPESYFHSALLWTGEISCQPGQDIGATNTVYLSSDDFPSWSWTGSIGPTTYRVMNLRESHTLHGSECPILRADIANIEVKEDTGFRKISRDIHGLSDTLSAINSVDCTKDTGTETKGVEGTLRFQAFLVPFNQFTINLNEEVLFETSDGLADYAIRDANSDICGVLFDMTVSLSARLLDSNTGLLSYIRLSSVLLPSEAVISAFEIFPKGDTDRDAKYKSAEYSIINVMLIRWKREGIAERVGICQMHSVAWSHAGPIKRLINLV